MPDPNRLDARVSVLETEGDNLSARLDRIEQLLQALLLGQQKHESLITWGKGGLYTLMAVGAAMLFLWNQLKGLVLGGRVT